MCSDYVCVESDICEGRRFEHGHDHAEWPSTGGRDGGHAEVEQDDGCYGCCKCDGTGGCDDGNLYGFDQEGYGDDIVDDHGHRWWREQNGKLVSNEVDSDVSIIGSNIARGASYSPGGKLFIRDLGVVSVYAIK